MICIPPQARVFAHPKPITAESDMDDLISACKAMGLDPYSGDLFAFKDVEATRIGVLAYDGHGFEWCIKRFSQGTIAWWPSEDEVVQMLPRDLEIMLWGGHPREVHLPPMWRPLHAVTGEPAKE
jgi:transposase